MFQQQTTIYRFVRSSQEQTSKMGHEWRRTGVAVRPRISHPVLVSVKGWKAHKFSWLSVYRETKRDSQGMDESADTCYPQTFQPLSHNHRLIIRHDPINVLSGCWLHLSKHVLHILEQDWASHKCFWTSKNVSLKPKNQTHQNWYQSYVNVDASTTKWVILVFLGVFLDHICNPPSPFLTHARTHIFTIW